jgi:hypothetical protein
MYRFVEVQPRRLHRAREVARQRVGVGPEGAIGVEHEAHGVAATPRAAEPLTEGLHRRRHVEHHDEVDLADVDAELHRARRHDPGEVALRERAAESPRGPPARTRSGTGARRAEPNVSPSPSDVIGYVVVAAQVGAAGHVDELLDHPARVREGEEARPSARASEAMSFALAIEVDALAAQMEDRARRRCGTVVAARR